MSARGPEVTPQDIEEMLHRAAQEAGINDLMKLMELAQEARGVDRMRAEMSEPQACATVATGTAGWVR
jgi:hypothetical protein